MILKTSSFSIQNNIKDLENLSKKYPNHEDIMTEEITVGKNEKTVHRRRDLDSLG